MARTMPRDEPGTLGFAIAVVLNFFLMILVNAHDAWRPLFGGIVTEKFNDVLWAVNLSFVVQIFGNLVLSVTRPLPLRRFMDLLFSATALLGAIVFYRVFPFDFARFAPSLEGFARMLFFFGVLVSGLAIVVNLFRFLAAAIGRGSHPHLPPTHHAGA